MIRTPVQPPDRKNSAPVCSATHSPFDADVITFEFQRPRCWPSYLLPHITGWVLTHANTHTAAVSRISQNQSTAFELLIEP
ncbi:hypothetical protein PAXRUDRAFT_827552 [Paxillus rubicundulus Ve08.2h10]|uniref:Unplaced genomic scaffold scaffold_256, whole genome shotgun sequence n=1 Tax=Paxillus rubicundulus Ve08.2h10 TaxID=930991 RepID=A0A0D0DCD4_9AGAM|nr:hypothetical protein PAXRUDRAFT_827552 [Paxillus rubicundulus Ve08.2h10]